MAGQGGRYVSFMRSFPNLMPLPASAVERIVESVRPYRFDRIHGGWWGKTVAAAAKETLERSAERYMRAVRGMVVKGEGQIRFLTFGRHSRRSLSLEKTGGGSERRSGEGPGRHSQRLSTRDPPLDLSGDWIYGSGRSAISATDERGRVSQQPPADSLPGGPGTGP